MAAGEADEDVFEAGLPGGEMQQLGPLLRDGFEQRRNGDVRLAHGERDESIIGAGGFDAGEGAPRVEAVVAGAGPRWRIRRRFARRAARSNREACLGR